MRTAVISIFALFALWAGFWVIGSFAQKSNTEDWFEAQREDGWIAEYRDLNVTGFPNRFDTVITGLNLADPRGGWAWEADEFKLLALSYNPNHLIAVWPQAQMIRTPDHRYNLSHERLRASAVFARGGDYRLKRSSLEGSKVEVQINQNETIKLETLALATRQGEGSAHDIAGDLTNITLSPERLGTIASSGLLPETIAKLTLRASPSFDAALDQPNFSSGSVNMTALKLDTFDLTWGVIKLRATGAVTLDNQGFPTGDLSIRAEHWEKLLEVAVSIGAVQPELTGAIEGALGLISRLSSNPNELDITLTFEGGQTYIGFIPLGPAPRLWQPRRGL